MGSDYSNHAGPTNFKETKKDYQMRLTIYNNYKEDLILSTNTTLEDLINIIQRGQYSLFVDSFRKASGTKDYEAYKALIPAFDLQDLEGMVYAETKETNLEEIKEIICCVAAWKKADGTGYAMLFEYQGFPLYEVPYVIKHISKDYNIKLTKSKCFTATLSADPEIYINDFVRPYCYFDDYIEEEEEEPVQETEAPEKIIEAPQADKKKSRYDYVYAQDLKQVHAKAVDFEGKHYIRYNEPKQIVEMFQCKRIPVHKHKSIARIMAAKRIFDSAARRKSADYSKGPQSGFVKDKIVVLEEGGENELTFWEFIIRDCTFLIDPITKKETITEEELRIIFFQELKKFKEGKMKVQTVYRHGKINPELSRQEKYTARGELTGEIRRAKSKSEVEKAILQLQEEGKTATILAIMLVTGFSRSTVKKYKKELKHLFDEESELVS